MLRESILTPGDSRSGSYELIFMNDRTDTSCSLGWFLKSWRPVFVVTPKLERRDDSAGLMHSNQNRFGGFGGLEGLEGWRQSM